MLGKMNVSVIIPSFNEECTIRDILQRCRPFADELIVALAKNSSDKTADIAKEEGARIIIDNGKGKGDGIRTAAKAAAGDILVFIDADGSHVPEDIPHLVKPIKAGISDLIVASRMRGGSDELYGTFFEFCRMVLGGIITLIINYRFNIHLTDSVNGFRCIRKEVFNSLNLKSNHMEIEAELIMKAAKKGYKISEVPSKEFARKGGKSKLSIAKHGWKFLWVVIANLF